MGVFSSNDVAFAKSHGINSNSLVEQWKRINNGFDTVHLTKAAVIDNGILRLNAEEESQYIALFKSQKENYNISKFVPASGAASRMFQPIRDMKDDPTSELSLFILSKLASFPFYTALLEKLDEKGISIQEIVKTPAQLANFILAKEGMDYDACPKGLIPFYTDGIKITCAFEQHVTEAKELGDDSVNFTVAQEYLDTISSLLNDASVVLSTQNSSTHFIAMADGKVVRDAEHEIILRPSGHGALLKNLNELDADIVFIKNIDNIQAPEKNEASLRVKNILGGYLIALKQHIDTFIFQLEEDKNSPLEEVKDWISKTFNAEINFNSKKEIINYLHRPLRIAGMVLNEGKVGGGPFWVKDKTGNHLQIVEGSQIDKNDPEQEKILNSSTHFNPVDIACSIVDHKGNKFDLINYVDKESGFLSKKQVEGKDAIIMERPGLWNGSMADWLTVFIEIPLKSFTPVKTILDLLPEN